MNTKPWDYWSDATTPRPEIVPVLAALESTIARSPKHPLALHLYLHAMEASATPGKAEKAADTLYALVPGSGHLVHMPAHIFWRVGRYNDAAAANIQAAKVDEAYIKQCNAQGFYPAMYYPHNIHFLWSAAFSALPGVADASMAWRYRCSANGCFGLRAMVDSSAASTGTISGRGVVASDQ